MDVRWELVIILESMVETDWVMVLSKSMELSHLSTRSSSGMVGAGSSVGLVPKSASSRAFASSSVIEESDSQSERFLAQSKLSGGVESTSNGRSPTGSLLSSWERVAIGGLPGVEVSSGSKCTFGGCCSVAACASLTLRYLEGATGMVADAVRRLFRLVDGL